MQEILSVVEELGAAEKSSPDVRRSLADLGLTFAYREVTVPQYALMNPIDPIIKLTKDVSRSLARLRTLPPVCENSWLLTAHHSHCLSASMTQYPLTYDSLYPSCHGHGQGIA